MRTFLAWTIGIFKLFVMTIFTDVVASLLGLTTFVNYDEIVTISNRYYDTEVDGHSTGFGYFFGFISFATAIRIGMAIETKSLSGGVGVNGNFMLLVVITALFVYGIANQIIYFVFEIPQRLATFVDLASALGIGFFAFRYYQQKRKDEWHEQNRNT